MTIIPGYYYFYDYAYILFMLPAFIFALVAQGMVRSAFNKYSQMGNRRNLTGAQAAEAILKANGVHGVRIERVGGSLTDHYDPKENVIRLSDSVYSTTSVSAVGVAAHEAGHAVQYAEGYGPIKARAAVIPVSRIGSQLSWPLVLLGLVLAFDPLIWAGIILFSTVTIFQLVTLPVEFNASSRAIATIEATGLMWEDEVGGVKKVLRAAALTYVAALATSITQLLRLLLMANRRSSKR